MVESLLGDGAPLQGNSTFQNPFNTQPNKTEEQLFGIILGSQGSPQHILETASTNGSPSAIALSESDTTNLLNGDYYSTQPQKSQATCPSNISMDQFINADGGLLKNMGNPQLTGKGAKGIFSGLKDNLAKLAGSKPGDIGTNKDVTMRALMTLESTKNMPASGGKILSADTRHNGNLSGLNPGGEADNGTEVGYLQNMSKNSDYTLPTVRGKATT